MKQTLQQIPQCPAHWRHFIIQARTSLITRPMLLILTIQHRQAPYQAAHSFQVFQMTRQMHSKMNLGYPKAILIICAKLRYGQKSHRRIIARTMGKAQTARITLAYGMQRGFFKVCQCMSLPARLFPGHSRA